MIDLIQEIHGAPVVLSTEPALEKMGRLLLSSLRSIPVEKLREGFRVQIGFSTYTFRATADGFRLLSPDYAGDPLRKTTEDMTIALWVLSEQTEMVAAFRVPESPIRFFDRILVAKGALEQPLISLQRYSDLGAEHSGWVVEALQHQPDGSIAVIPSEYDNLFGFQLLKQRPALIKALVLPYDYFVIFEGDEILEIKNEINESIL